MNEFVYNPILKGFNPDPSIVRVGQDYYIATSTFDWFPGVQIHHSDDLANWKLITRLLRRTSQINMVGNPDSGGVWAADISYNQGIFYLVYTNVKCHKNMWRDMHNYLITSKDVQGDWSEPIYLNSVGHDPSLFHDDDGKKWLLNSEWEYINGKNVFNGIVIQEYLNEKESLIGQRYNIFKGTAAGFTEGSHLYKVKGYYYLITAEGGTWYNHCVTVARSNSILGPYEMHPGNPVLTSKDDVSLKLQKSGHADLVMTPDGEWYMVYLCSRPITSYKRCVMGRETAIQKITWKDDGWFYVDGSGNKPLVKIKSPAPYKYAYKTEYKDDFENEVLDINFQSLRVPLNEDSLSLKERKGFLRLKGHESLSSLHLQSLIARRQQSFYYSVETVLEFDPSSTKHMAGLVVYYNTENYYYLCVSYNAKSAKNLRIITCNKNKPNEPLCEGMPIGNAKRIGLRIVVNQENGQFYYNTDENEWSTIGDPLDMSKLSDDYIGGRAFTGTFIGLCCQDLSGDNKNADFDYFYYKET